MHRTTPVLLAFLLPGCFDGGEEGKLADCAGTYAGLIEGDATGTLDAQLDTDGAFSAVVYTEETGVTVSSSGEVAEDGTLTGEEQDVTFAGSFDFDACTADGTWASAIGVGTWDLTLLD
jgi:hypothetical protein